ncbi:hypothetical protein H5410_027784 [Solanum commersonii]|uniref:Uncharacterized protein n=1 Tax=Solanum commersonii TaxID=4109 RepID=A0A9J5Z4C2_SOLCO|nr:hypothetical protein H5410_027784 [Solanum commersonii]
MSMLFGTVETPNMPSANIPTCSEVPSATTGEEAETNEDHLGVREEIVYDDLVDLEGAMFETARQASLWDTSMLSSSGAKDAETPGINAQTDGVLHLRTTTYFVGGETKERGKDTTRQKGANKLKK